MRLFVFALLLVLACDKPAATTASSWTLKVTSNGVTLGTTPIKVTFLQDVVCAVPPCNAQAVGTAEGQTDVNGIITMPVLITGIGGTGGGRADRARIEVLRQEPVEVPFGAQVVDVGPLVGDDVPRVPAESPAPPSSPSTWKLKLTSKGAPLANTKVTAKFVQSVQCIAAPCPTQMVGSSDATTDASGNAAFTIPSGGLSNSPTSAELTVEGHAMIETGIGAATIDVP
jgi:hypothetical protein